MRWHDPRFPRPDTQARPGPVPYTPITSTPANPEETRTTLTWPTICKQPGASKPTVHPSLVPQPRLAGNVEPSRNIRVEASRVARRSSNLVPGTRIEGII